MSRKTGLVILSVLLLAVLLTAAVLILRPDWRYVVTDTLTHMGSKPALSPAEGLTLREQTMEALLEDPRVAWEQSALLIRTDYPLSEAFVADVVEYNDTGVVMNRCAIDGFQALSGAVRERFEQTLFVESAYRSREQQLETLRNNPTTATQVDASEHQAGLALDVYAAYYAGSGFIKSPVGRYVNDNCWKYGFIIRYPYYGGDKTGIAYEPWHLRYVGIPHAEVIHRGRLTLEEYIALLEPGQIYTVDGYLICRQVGPIFQLPEDYTSLTISPDNTGAYLLTIKID